MRSRIMKMKAPRSCPPALLLACGTVLLAPVAQAGTGLNVTETWGWHHGNTAVTEFRSAAAPSSALHLGFGSPRTADMRVASVGLRGGFGSLSIEQQWLPPLELTAATALQMPLFERIRHNGGASGHTLSWSSPRHAGWSIGASYAQGLQQWQYGPSTDNRMFGAVSYSSGGLTLSGASDGAHDWNLLGSYTEGRNTWRLALTRFDGDDDPVLQFGLDHRYSRALTFFAAFQHDDDGPEPTRLRQRSFGIDAGLRSGRGIMTGLRYDF